MLQGLNLLTIEFILIGAIIFSLGCAAFAQTCEKVTLLPNFVFVPIIGLITFLLITGSQSGLVFSQELMVVDGVSQFGKSLVSLLLMGALTISAVRILHSDKHFNPHRLEYFTILLISSLGMMVMISANDLITFYMGLEIQSLSLYILIAFRRADSMASEAALKYLILGAVGSGLFLYGTSLLFGATGGVSYEVMHRFAFMSGDNLLYLIGLTLVFTAIFFKLSAAPFHMWTPDVYQGAPIFVTTFVATAPKVAAIFGLLRMVGYAFQPVFENFQSIFIVASILSLIVGAIMAIRQTSLLRLVAYSTITHMGYVLLGFAASKEVFNFAVIEYISVYAITSFGLFAFLGGLRINNKTLQTFSDLSGLAKIHAPSAIILTIFMFSLAGIPPLAGFFIKFSVLQSAANAGLIYPVIIAVLASAVSAFYYLKIIKTAYFDEAADNVEISIDKTHYYIAVSIAVLIVLYVFYPAMTSDILAYYIAQYGTVV